MWYKIKRIYIKKWKKKLYCNEFFYLNSNKKLLMWYKKWKKWNALMLIGGEKYKKIKKKKKNAWTVLFCSVFYQTRPPCLILGEKVDS
jgi:hypothetical protein